MKFSYKQTVAIVYTIVLFLDRLDLTVVNSTLPTVSRYFGVALVSTEWISLSFLLALSISIPVSGWLGDYFGLKKLYIIAMILFGTGSTICAFANTFFQLVAFRFLQGVGGGLLIPIGMTIIYRIYDKSEYASITSFTFLPALSAPAIAPFLGGILLDTWGWRFVFMFSGPICLMLALYSMLQLKEEEHQVKYPLDFFGFIICSAILIDTFYALSQISRFGFSIISSLEVVILIPLIWLFINIEQRNQYPLINLKLFKNTIFVRANLIQLCFQICHFGAIFLVGLFLQVGIRFSATLAGLIMGMQAIGAMTTSRYSVKLFNLYGPKIPIIIGLSGVAILSPMILLINTQHMLFYGIVLFFVRGVFSGLCGTPIQTLSVISFQKNEINVINGIFNVCRQISISLGVVISSMLISFGMHIEHITSQALIRPENAFNIFAYGFWVIPLIAIIGIWQVMGLKYSNS